jgi:YesN/AraC family two-component response regulator
MRCHSADGYPDFDSAVEGINGEVDAYLVKPADIEKLLKTIEQKLAARMLRKS